MQVLQETDTYSSTTSDCGSLPRFPTKSLSRAVASCGSANYEDPVPPHVLVPFLHSLHNVFSGEWIVHGGPWHARSPVLNPIDFCTPRHLKSTVCAAEVSDVQD